MKLFTKTNTIGGAGERSLPVPGTSYDIPTGTVTWLSIILIAVQTAGTSVGNYLTDKLKKDVESRDVKLKEENFKLQLLQRALEINNPEDRRATLILLVKTDLLADNKRGELIKFIDTARIPQWPPRTLEAMDGKSQVKNTSTASQRAGESGSRNIDTLKSSASSPGGPGT